MKAKLRTLCLALCTIYLLLNTNTTNAQNCDFTLSGITKEEHNPEPLSYAVIRVLELDTIITSDDEGHYIFQNLCEGRYTLVCSFLGFRTDTQTVYVNKDKGVFFNLHPENCELDEVVIEAECIKSLPTRAVQDIVELVPVIRSTDKTSTGTITRNISGGSSLNTGTNTAKPVFHGLHSNRLKVLVNGIPIENQQWGAEHGLDLGDFENPRMNNSSGIYHDAIGGILNSFSSLYIENYKHYKHNHFYDNNWYGLAHQITGVLNSEFNSNGQSNITSGYLTGNFKKMPYLGWKVFGGFGRGGDIQTPNYNLKNTGFANYNFGYQSKINLGRLDVEVYYKNVHQESGIFTGSHIGNASDFFKAVEAEKPNDVHTGDFSYVIGGPFQRINHEMVMGRLLWSDYGKKLYRYDLCYSRQYNKRQEFDVHDLDKAGLHLELTTHYLSGITSFQFDTTWENEKELDFGFNGMYQANTWRNSQFVPNYLKKKGGVFIGYRDWSFLTKVNNRVELTSKFLYDVDQTDVYRIIGKNTVYENLLFHSPAANVELKTQSKGKDVELDGVKYRNVSFYTLGAASTWRAPAINELYSGGIHHSAASLEFGNPSLKRENSYKMYFKIQRPTKKFDLAVTFHSNFIQNYIYSAPTGRVILTVKGAFPEFTYNQTDALLSGADFDFTYNWNKRFSTLTKSTFLHAYDFDENNGLIGIPANRVEQSLTYKLSKDEKQKGLYATVGGSYFMRQYNSNLNFELVNPPKGYFLLDANLKYNLKIGKDEYSIRFMTLRFEINNVLNAQYRDYMNRNRFFANEMGRNFKLSLEIPFNIKNTEINNYE